MCILRSFAILIAVVIISGCNKPEVKKYKPVKAVEDMTGMTTIKNGERIKQQMKEVEKSMKEREKELEAIK